MRTTVTLICLALFQTGCASYGKISNFSSAESLSETNYSIKKTSQSQRSSDVTLVMSFSGGGTRAAALAYGVLQALRETTATFDGKPQRLIDEIDLISSVSGGSFTAAYFGLNGDQIFDDFENKFLRRDIGGELIHGLFNPGLWFSKRGRTEMAVQYYEDKVFNEATFADLYNRQGPFIVINASDIGRGVRFSFIQEYFDLICSDLSSFPVSRAVTASSAVPVVFNPVVLKNYDGCDTRAQEFLNQAKKHTVGGHLEDVVDGLTSYADKQERQYIHLVDGGITDNLGLLAIYEMVEVAGGAKAFMNFIGGKPSPNFVVISVNASTKPTAIMELSNEIPSLEDTINAITDTQLHRTNTNTLGVFKNSIKKWSEELSTADKPVEPYFIEIDFKGITEAKRRLLFNQIPVSFSLQKEQVDDLIKVGRELLLTNPEFKRFIENMK